MSWFKKKISQAAFVTLTSFILCGITVISMHGMANAASIFAPNHQESFSATETQIDPVTGIEPGKSMEGIPEPATDHMLEARKEYEAAQTTEIAVTVAVIAGALAIATAVAVVIKRKKR